MTESFEVASLKWIEHIPNLQSLLLILKDVPRKGHEILVQLVFNLTVLFKECYLFA